MTTIELYNKLLIENEALKQQNTELEERLKIIPIPNGIRSTMKRIAIR